MVAKYLLMKLLLSSWCLEKAFTQKVKYTWLEEYDCVGIDRTNWVIYFFVCWKHIFIVTHSGLKNICYIFIGICSNRFVENLISNDIWLGRHIWCYYLPHFGKMIQQTSLIGKEILLKFHQILSQIKLWKRNFKTILS
jgi:hypothetical protein